MGKDGPRRRVRRGRFDAAQMMVTIGSSGNEHRYSCAGLPAPVTTYLQLLGLKSALLAQKDADDAYEALRSGVVPEQRPPAIPRKSKWREAIAHALAHAKAQQDAPKGTRRSVVEQMAQAELPEMKRHAGLLSKDMLRRLRERADVQEHYRRMFGTRPSDAQTSLLALAGLVEDMPEGSFPNDNANPTPEHAAA